MKPTIARIVLISMMIQLVLIPTIPSKPNEVRLSNTTPKPSSNSPLPILASSLMQNTNGCDAYHLCSTRPPVTCNDINRDGIPDWPAAPGMLYPQWVYAHQSPEDPKKVRIEGWVTESVMPYGDMPVNHSSRDRNFFLLPTKPDDEYTVSKPGNWLTGELAERGKIEVEWESAAFPMWALPVADDYVDVEGALVFDCGHKVDDGTTTPQFRSEIHPPRAMMVLRGGIGGSMNYLYDSNNLAPNHMEIPIQVTHADIFGSSDGGNIIEDLECFKNIASCPRGHEWYQPLAEKSYSFFVPAPPKPAVDAQLIYQDFERPMPMFSSEDSNFTYNIALHEKERINYTILPDGVLVTIDFTGFDPQQRISAYGFGLSVLVGWKLPSVDNSDPIDNIQAPVRLEVSLNSLINNDFSIAPTIELFTSVEHLSSWHKVMVPANTARSLNGRSAPEESIVYPTKFDVFIPNNTQLNIHTRGVQQDLPLNQIIGDGKFAFNRGAHFGISNSNHQNYLLNNASGDNYDIECRGEVGHADPPCLGLIYSIRSIQLDLLFVVDTTGSMATGLAAVKAEIKQLVSYLESSGVDYRIAIIDVKDIEDYPKAVRTELGFSNNDNSIIAHINNLKAGGGGSELAEPIYSGLMLGFTNSDGTVGAWRNNASKYAVVFTDTAPQNPEKFGKRYTDKDVLRAAKALDPAVISAVLMGDDPEAREAIKPLATETGGLYLNPTSYEGIREALHTVVNDSIPPMAPLNGATVQFATSIITITEALSQTTIPVVLSASIPTTVTVPYQTMAHGLDEQAFTNTMSGTLVFPPDTSYITVTMPISDNILKQPTTYLGLRLGEPRADDPSVPILVGMLRSMAVVVQDNDRVGLVDSTFTVGEHEGSTPITVTLDRAYSAPISVTYALSSGTALLGSDLPEITGTLIFAPGQTSAVMTIPISDDTAIEGNEFVTILLDDVTDNIEQATPAGQLVIRDDEIVHISPPTETISEDKYWLVDEWPNIAIDLLHPLPQDVSFRCRTVAESATVEADFYAKNELITIPAGETHVTCFTRIKQDEVIESAETYRMEITDPTNIGVDVAANASRVTIYDDEQPFSPHLRDHTFFINESDGQIVIDVDTQSSVPTTRTVQYRTTDGTARSGSDYQATTGTLIFAPFETTATFTIPVTQDFTSEDAEEFSVALFNPSFGTLKTPSGATIYISANDRMSFYTEEPRLREFQGLASTNLMLSSPITEDIAIHYRTLDGTAQAGSDYQPISTTVILPAMGVSDYITVPINLDTDLAELDETFTLEATTIMHGTAVTATQTFTIVNALQGIQPKVDTANYYDVFDPASATPPATTWVEGTDQLTDFGDDKNRALSFPFEIPFYGSSFTTATVSLHGNLRVGGGTLPAENQSLSWLGLASQGVIAPLWDDITSGDVYTATGGLAPNRFFAIEWRNLSPRLGDYEDYQTFEVVFHEDGRINFNYQTLTGLFASGNGATIGLTHPVQDAWLEYSQNTAVITAPMTILLQPKHLSIPDPTPTPTIGATTTAVPSETPTVVPSETPTVVPSETPTAVPSETPTAVPSETPTATPVPAGPQMLRDIASGSTGGIVAPNTFVTIGSTTFFIGNDGIAGAELWKTDGTMAGTVMVKDIRAGATGSSIPYTSMINVNGILFFAANDGIHGPELWKSDGTEAGTVMVKDILAGSDGAGVNTPLAVNGTLFMATIDETHGFELWTSDGTEAGTTLVIDLVAGIGSSGIMQLTNVNGTVFFINAPNNSVSELWKTDGTAAGTILVKNLKLEATTPAPSNLRAIGNTLFFTINSAAGVELWKSDGTTAGTVLVKDIASGSASSNPANLSVINGLLYFAANDGVAGTELWTSDGTAAGTNLFKDINLGTASSSPSNITLVNSTIYFTANDSTNGGELWKTDGTAAGTMLVKDIRPGTNGSFTGRLTNVDGVLYFTANDGTSGTELWTSDGTAAGTTMISDINSGSLSASPNYLSVTPYGLVFGANNGTNGTELWGLTLP